MSDDWESDFDESLIPWETAEDRADLIRWQSEYDDDESSDSGPPDDDDEAAWLRGLPDDVRADYLAGTWIDAGESQAGPAGFPHHADGPSARGFAAGGAYDAMAPGPDLAQMVAMTIAGGYADLGESELTGVLCAWQRLISWAQAGQAGALTALTDRRKLQSFERDRPSLFEHLDDEVAAALHLTCYSADRVLSIAAGLARLCDVHAALSRGELDLPRACLFVEQLAVLPDQAAKNIVDSLLDRARDMTTGQLRAALARAILAADPEASERRKEAARKEADVQVWTEASGNAAIVGRELRPSEVVTANERLSALARWLKSRGVEGSVDQLRAAVFVALLNGRSVQSLVPPHAEGAPGTNNASPGDAATPDAAMPDATVSDWPQLTGTINLTMPMSSWLGLANSPGELASYGPVDAVTGRELADAMAGDTQWCLTLTDQTGRTAAHACARKGPGPRGCTGIRWAAHLKERLQFLETSPCGHSRQSGSYKPPPSLRHLVEVRQRTCSFPGCRRAARRCDLDHTVPFDHGGPTCECNLAPLCRRHHQAKQAPGWHLDQTEPGRMTWRLPTGRTYQTTGDSY
jgi:hypothetical protein